MPHKKMSTPKRGKKTTKKEPKVEIQEEKVEVEEEEETMAKIEQYMEETNVSIRPSWWYLTICKLFDSFVFDILRILRFFCF